MKIFQARDLLRYKIVTLEVPENVELNFKQLILLKGAREKVVAEVVGMPRTLPGARVDEDLKFLKTLNQDEIESYQSLQEKGGDLLHEAQKAADELGLKMYFFHVQIGWEEKTLACWFTSEQPIDFRDLLKVLTPKVKGRLHLQRLDPRDRADVVGGPRCCGRPECCDVRLSTKKISLDAVRDQGIVIRGNDKLYDVSGKLKRCLLHEVDMYRANRKYLPHIKQRVTVDGKAAQVRGLDILNRRVKVSFDDTDVIEFYPVAQVEYQGKQVAEEKPLEFTMPDLQIEGELPA
jgi:cell fate regulator YaaT (PSP1 superfamily)